MDAKEIEIQARNIDAAADEIIGVLEDTNQGNVIYFGGWGGLGASAVLNLVAQRLKSSRRPDKFDKVIHVDCSVWKSMRVLQKAIAEEVELPHSVMAVFDQCDEDDDFNGTDQGSRGVIAHISGEIFRKLVNSRFVVVFHNGSRRYIDLYECGVPVISLLSNKVLWTWHGRFRLRLVLEDGEREKMKRRTDVDLRTSLGSDFKDKELRRDLMREEAEEVAKCTGIVEPDYMNQNVVKHCFLYGFTVKFFAFLGMDLGTHVSNYWICDGIIQGQGDTSSWEIGDRLHRNMQLDWVVKDLIDAEDHLDKLLTDFDVNRWVFAGHQGLPQDDDTGVLPPEATSFFIYLDVNESPIKTVPVLPVSMLQHSKSSKLRVLYLSRCTFRFTSPPFLSCSQLRLLHLDHCTDMTVQEHPSNNGNILCFQKLWVLSLRHTEWYWLLSEKMKSLMVDLRELNVEGVKHGSVIDLCHGRPSLVMLRVTEDEDSSSDEDTTNQAPSNMSNANNVVISDLINEVLSPSLESFSFINKAETAAKISSISFRGCSRLKSILLRGFLGSLEELDLSGTAVKTLDLREVQAPNLKRLILLDCKKLCAILWPPENKRTHVLEVLHINTIRFASPSRPNCEESTEDASAATRSSSIHNVATTLPAGISQAASFHFNWHISIRDARLLRSLEPVYKYSYSVHMEMDSPPASSTVVGGSEVAQGIGSLHQPGVYLYARDIVFGDHLQASAPNVGAIGWKWASPPTPSPRDDDWYVHLQDADETKWGLLQEQGSSFEGTSTGAALPPRFIRYGAWSLHVHDNSCITCIPSQGERFDWNSIRLCQVERCHKLRTVFATPQVSVDTHIFRWLTTLWVSQLPVACYIWNWSAISQPGGRSFEDLVFLHLDYCPRLIHVLPFYKHMATLPSLETLEIVCCGDLREVFPLDPKRQEGQKIIEFPNLRRIHLYELPMLQHICGSKMSAPKLETVKIRGCWSLRRLPAVNGNTTKRPKVDCEKDSWDNLEWDGLAANHHPSLYNLTHSMYYKAKLPRGPLLR